MNDFTENLRDSKEQALSKERVPVSLRAIILSLVVIAIITYWYQRSAWYQGLVLILIQYLAIWE